ncbi:MAG: hypothetical protein AB1486_22490 [Planctomycetota bacterium]
MKGRAKSSGITIVEMTVTLGIFAVVLMAAIQALVGGSTAQRQLTTTEVLEEQTRRVTERLVNYLRQAGVYTLQDVPEAPATSSSIRFRRMIQFDPWTGPSWSPEERLFHQLDAGETDNDLDDDSDGRADNGVLVWASSPRWEIWGTDVVNVAFSRTGRTVEITLECAVAGNDGAILTTRRRTDVYLEN